MKHEPMSVLSLYHDHGPGCILERVPMHKGWLITTPITKKAPFLQVLQHVLRTYLEAASPSLEEVGRMCLACGTGGLDAPNGPFGTHNLEGVYLTLSESGEATVEVPLTELCLNLTLFGDAVAYSCNDKNGRRFGGADTHMGVASARIPGMLVPFVREYRVRRVINRSHTDFSVELHAKLMRLHFGIPALEWVYGTGESLAVALLHRFGIIRKTSGELHTILWHTDGITHSPRLICLHQLSRRKRYSRTSSPPTPSTGLILPT